MKESHLKWQGAPSRLTVQSNTFMHGAIDTPTCLRRGTCDPLGNWNVLASLRSLRSDDRLILATAALDSTSLFKDQAVGAAGTVSALAVLLMAAKLLGGLQPNDMPPKNILFAFFNGEAYDYIGSSRFAMDINEGKFPRWVKYVFISEAWSALK